MVKRGRSEKHEARDRSRGKEREREREREREIKKERKRGKGPGGKERLNEANRVFHQFLLLLSVGKNLQGSIWKNRRKKIYREQVEKKNGRKKKKK